MPGFLDDYNAQVQRSAAAIPWLLEANRRVAGSEFGRSRFIPG